MEINGQVQIQQGNSRHWAQLVAFFIECQFPGGVGCQTRSATDVVLIVPVNLGLEEGVGVFIIGDFFKSQEGNQTVLKGAEAAFDFAFGRGVGSDAMSDSEPGKGSLELRVCVESVGGRGMAEEGQAVGVEAGWHPVLFDNLAKVKKVRPSGVAGSERATQDFTGMVVQRQNEAGVGVSGPPSMGGTVVLPEFADGGTLPTAAGFGTAFERGDQVRELLSDISGDGSTRTMEVEFASQFIGQQGKIQWPAMWQAGG